MASLIYECLKLKAFAYLTLFQHTSIKTILERLSYSEEIEWHALESRRTSKQLKNHAQVFFVLREHFCGLTALLLTKSVVLNLRKRTKISIKVHWKT